MGVTCNTNRKIRTAYNTLSGSLKRNYMRDIGVDGRIILKWIIEK
jgi:hypothetical protein